MVSTLSGLNLSLYLANAIDGEEEGDIPAKRVSKTKDHVVEGVFRDGAEELGQLATNASHELEGGAVVDALDVQFVLDETAQLAVGDGELVLQVGLDDVLLQEFSEAVIQGIIDKGRGSG